MAGETETTAREEVSYLLEGTPGLRLTITRIGRLGLPALRFHGALTFVAWMLRRVADRMDGTVSYTYSGTVPLGCTKHDWPDAVEFGATAMARYLSDLAKERRHA